MSQNDQEPGIQIRQDTIMSVRVVESILARTIAKVQKRSHLQNQFRRQEAQAGWWGLSESRVQSEEEMVGNLGGMVLNAL